jgi:lipid II:glycine glycyltransferase (peptidoglycan interpeptide bridge formation enzyme)
MVAKNDITGDNIQSRGNSKAYAENLVKIFGDKSEEKALKAKEKAEYFARLNAETDKLTRNNEETQEALKNSK